MYEGFWNGGFIVGCILLKPEMLAFKNLFITKSVRRRPDSVPDAPLCTTLLRGSTPPAPGQWPGSFITREGPLWDSHHLPS